MPRLTRVAARVAPAVVAVLVLLVALDPPPATAHAVLLRGIPSSAQSLTQLPQSVQLLFSEPIDPVFSNVSVLNASGQAVDTGDGHVDDTDDHQLVATLKPGLPNGIYTVVWRSLSTIDVHPDDGRYPLFVGVPVSAGSQAPTSTQLSATPATTFGRWWFYLAASLFGGVLATWKIVLSGALVGENAAPRAAARRRAHRLVVVGGVLLVLGTLFTAGAQAAAAANVPLTDAAGRPLADLLLRGRFATIWWPRLGLEIASLLLIMLGGLEGLAAECALATLPAVLLTSSLTSHGAALPTSGPGIAIDWLHIVGATVWVGGLMSLLLVLPVIRGISPGVLPGLIARFGRFALIASALVLLSGTLQAGLEVDSWSSLVASTYGQLVLVKITLLAGMIVLAIRNAWRGRRGIGTLRRGVRMELALGIVVLGVAAVLSGTPPARGSLATPAAGRPGSAAARGSAARAEAAATATSAAGWTTTAAVASRAETTPA